MKPFLFRIYVFACLVALVTTLLLWGRSFDTLDEWHGWQFDGPSCLTHLYVQSNTGRIEVYVDRVRRVNAFGQPAPWPPNQVPTYPPTQYRNVSPTKSAWGYADSFVPTPKPTHDFNWAHEFRSEPADEVPAKFSWRTALTRFESATRHEDRWLVAFPYGFLAALFALPVVWKSFFGGKKKPPASPATTAVAKGS